MLNPYCDSNPAADNSNHLVNPSGSFAQTLYSSVTLPCAYGYSLTSGSPVVNCSILNSTTGQWTILTGSCSRVLLRSSSLTREKVFQKCLFYHWSITCDFIVSLAVSKNFTCFRIHLNLCTGIFYIRTAIYVNLFAYCKICEWIKVYNIHVYYYIFLTLFLCIQK